ncbi:hypothetical protein [Brevundimonas sp.]|uniref:hypothetical protein n=1 Tax=Brevundimonas sp. TaxID=1871086 RepID=UPI002738032C|nr:hypothetical protein [Brevundimonas sp.]MDP3803689.1 hypothetical protein [Brevundimonas sp.]
MTKLPRDQMESETWTQDGAFAGSDGRAVRCYDDVVLSRAIPVDGGVGTAVDEVPAGTVGTVLFYSTGPVGVAQLECYVGDDAFTFGYEELSRLKLHMTNEEKYAR